MKNEGFGVNELERESRELVPFERTAAAARCVPVRPLAGFLVQLLACHAGLALFRVRRRAEPKDAHAVYTRENLPPPHPRFERRL
jgi:hypothetical protein